MIPARHQAVPALGILVRLPSRRRRFGMGDAASDYAAIAAQLTPGSADYQLFTGCAANPTAPACAQATADALTTPYLTAADSAAVQQAIAAGTAPPPVTAYTGPPPGTQLPTPAPTTPTYHPSAQLKTPRGGSVFFPGDTWSIVITGGQPNAPVKVVGGANGQQVTTVYGNTDANGSFALNGLGRAKRARGSLRGTFASSDVGTWQETWYVGSDLAGNFAFQIQPTPTTTAPATTAPAPASSAPASTTASDATSSSGSGTVNDLITAGSGLFNTVSNAAQSVQAGLGLGSIPPLVLWGGAAAIALWMFQGKGRKHRS